MYFKNTTCLHWVN